MSKEYKNRIVKKTSRSGRGLMVSLPTGEGNYVDTWINVNEKSVLPEGITNVNELFGLKKKIDIEVRETPKGTYLN